MKIKNHAFPVLLSLSASLLLAPLAGAQEVDNRANVYLGWGEYLFDNDRRVDDDSGAYLGGEIPFTNRWSGSLEYWEIDSSADVPANIDVDAEWWRFGGNYHLNSIGNWQPYTTIGLGHLDIEPAISGFGIDEATVDAGVGFKYFFTENFLVRGDARAIVGTEDEDLDFGFGLSVGYAFGPRSTGPARPARTPDPVDSDGDGVPDERDNCANTPPGADVDERGCEFDSDRDGVVDSRDECPDTSPQVAVDERGCPILDVTQRTQEIEVNFDFDSAEIRPEYQGEIREFAEFMREYPQTEVVIEGHTDDSGPEVYNQGLSERRARAVMNALIEEHGIDPDRLEAVGYGESRPIADNDTREGRQRNRRIMAEVSVEIEEERRR